MMIILVIAILIVIFMQVIECSQVARSASPDFDRAPEETYELIIEDELAYVCPINCENGKTYKEEGNCPVCDLPLKARNEKEISQEKTVKKDSINPGKADTQNDTSDQN